MTDPTPSTEPPESRQVSRFEANLLRMLRFFFIRCRWNRLSNSSTKAWLAHRVVGERLVHLIRDTLSKGCVLYLARAGGWERLQFLCDGAPRFGRLWERIGVEELTLHFSAHTLEFLIWITAHKVNRRKIDVVRLDRRADYRRLAVLVFRVNEGLRSSSNRRGALAASRLPQPSSVQARRPIPMISPGRSLSKHTILSGWAGPDLAATCRKRCSRVLEERGPAMERNKGEDRRWT